MKTKHHVRPHSISNFDRDSLCTVTDSWACELCRPDTAISSTIKCVAMRSYAQQFFEFFSHSWYVLGLIMSCCVLLVFWLPLLINLIKNQILQLDIQQEDWNRSMTWQTGFKLTQLEEILTVCKNNQLAAWIMLANIGHICSCKKSIWPIPMDNVSSSWPSNWMRGDFAVSKCTMLQFVSVSIFSEPCGEDLQPCV